MAFEKELAKAQALDLLQCERKNYIETQSLWRILVEKGICTIDEVKSKREYVEKTSPRVREIDRSIKELQGDVDAPTAWSPGSMVTPIVPKFFPSHSLAVVRQSASASILIGDV